jgi:hypothetical protein
LVAAFFVLAAKMGQSLNWECEVAGEWSLIPGFWFMVGGSQLANCRSQISDFR